MMTPNAMASFIISQIQGKNSASKAINAFYSALCDYVESEAEIQYLWSATTPPLPFIPPSTPDPITLLSCRIRTSGNLSPSGAKTPEEALGRFAADLNAQVSTWQVIWPSGFVLPPAFILPAIVFTPSMATKPEAAWDHVCREIILGITEAATPGPLPGTHGNFTIPTPGAVWIKTL